jgi:hypothetical protein
MNDLSPKTHKRFEIIGGIFIFLFFVGFIYYNRSGNETIALLGVALMICYSILYVLFHIPVHNKKYDSEITGVHGFKRQWGLLKKFSSIWIVIGLATLGIGFLISMFSGQMWFFIFSCILFFAIFLFFCVWMAYIFIKKGFVK